MNRDELPLIERSINDIYFGKPGPVTYQIPIYQRNYAWEDDQIFTLVKDVYDSLKKPTYYIGTLVTYKRGDMIYEVIDGQQRLTTIYLILKALKIDNIPNKLTYTARSISAETLNSLPRSREEFDAGILNGFKYAKNAITEIVGEGETERNEFKEYFLNCVHIIHYQVPRDVDLNHYFEVMNSRGEQLEMHEIVKATLSSYLKDKEELAKFSRIWEACSNMSIYIQQAFQDATIFGDKLNDFRIDSFDEVPYKSQVSGKETIREMMDERYDTEEDSNVLDQSDTFQPIIDFPNFLLQVLKLTLFKSYPDYPLSDFPLDDKELLHKFDDVLNNMNDEKRRTFVKTFSLNLLKSKYFLDNYIVHHVDDQKERIRDNPWNLQYYYKDSKKKGYFKNLHDDDGVNKELVHLLSMFEVAFTARQRKNYLFYCLVHLFENKNVDDYLLFLRNLADKYFFDVYLDKTKLNKSNQPIPNAFDQVILKNGKLNVTVNASQATFPEVFNNIYPIGSYNIPLFVFNYTDYKIWKKYATDLMGEGLKEDSRIRGEFFDALGCSDFGLDFFKDFYFSRTRKSLEHFYPQAKAFSDNAASDNGLTQSQINCFGNFAMIGADANSSGSNWDPKTKLDHYMDSKSNPVSVASLKFRIMMQICDDNRKKEDRPHGMEWNAEDIERHEKNMLELLQQQA